MFYNESIEDLKYRELALDDIKASPSIDDLLFGDIDNQNSFEDEWDLSDESWQENDNSFI